MGSFEATVEKIGPVWRELHGGLWHTTHPVRFLSILKSAAILPEPPIADSDRWATRNGPTNHPYARFIGGLSLFDLHSFDSEAYSAKFPSSSWREFVPYRRRWGGAAWIEIDREKAPALIPGHDLLARWRAGDDLAHNLMPIVEAAHLGPLPLSAMKRCVIISAADHGAYDSMDIAGFDHAFYESWLKRWRATVSEEAWLGCQRRRENASARRSKNASGMSVGRSCEGPPGLAYPCSA